MTVLEERVEYGEKWCKSSLFLFRANEGLVLNAFDLAMHSTHEKNNLGWIKFIVIEYHKFKCEREFGTVVGYVQWEHWITALFPLRCCVT